MGKCKENKRRVKRTGRIVTIGKVADIPAGRGAAVMLRDGSEIAVSNCEGHFTAVENFCPHKGYPLSDSEVEGNTLKCRFHGWEFDVRTGECLTRKGCGIEVYEVFVESGRLKVRV